MSDMKKVNVTIDQQKFTLVAETNEQRTREIADYVDQAITNIRENNRKLNPSMTYILAMMNVTGEYFKSKDSLERFREFSDEPLENIEDMAKLLKKMTEEKNNLNVIIDQLKDDMVKSLNTISDMNKRFQELEVDNNQHVAIIKELTAHNEELMEGLTQKQQKLIETEQKVQDSVRWVSDKIRRQNGD